MSPIAPERGFPRFDHLEAEFSRLLADEADQREAARPHRLLAAGGAAVAAVATAVVLLVFVLPGDGGSLGGSPAQAALRQYADAAKDTGLTAQPGQFLYQRKLTDTALGFNLDPNTGELTAVPPPGPVDSYIADIWLNGKGDGTFQVKEQGGQPVMSGESGSGSGKALVLGLTYEEVLGLPRDPEELLAKMRSLGASTDAGEVGSIASLLDTPLPPDLQAALLDAAALIPGAELIEGIMAPTGESLTAISYATNRPGVTYELLFDPASNTYEGHSITVASGERYYGSLILERAVVTRPGEIPGG